MMLKCVQVFFSFVIVFCHIIQCHIWKTQNHSSLPSSSLFNPENKNPPFLAEMEFPFLFWEMVSWLLELCAESILMCSVQLSKQYIWKLVPRKYHVPSTWWFSQYQWGRMYNPHYACIFTEGLSIVIGHSVTNGMWVHEPDELY